MKTQGSQRRKRKVVANCVEPRPREVLIQSWAALVWPLWGYVCNIFKRKLINWRVTGVTSSTISTVMRNGLKENSRFFIVLGKAFRIWPLPNSLLSLFAQFLYTWVTWMPSCFTSPYLCAYYSLIWNILSTCPHPQESICEHLRNYQNPSSALVSSL